MAAQRPLDSILNAPISLAEQVREQLRTAIVLGDLPPGQRLVELEIAARMGTSQGPVREALQQLENEGLVERHARSGTFVSSIHMDEMYELFAIRSVVEGFAVRRAARVVTDANVDELQRLVDQMRAAATDDDMDLLVANDMLFHRRICELSGSTNLLRVWLPLYAQIQRLIHRTHRRIFRNLAEIAETHQPIVDALRDHDAERTRTLLEAHIMLIWNHVNLEGDASWPS